MVFLLFLVVLLAPSHPPQERQMYGLQRESNGEWNTSSLYFPFLGGGEVPSWCRLTTVCTIEISSILLGSTYSFKEESGIPYYTIDKPLLTLYMYHSVCLWGTLLYWLPQ
jgi:hypothetical protein